MDTVISTENLGKKYLIFHQQLASYTALRDVITDGFKKLTRNDLRKVTKREEFWALRNIYFNIQRGDKVGIIGRNGAGKTTLLKILSRITEPSEGKATIIGRVSSLLEVGTGFHPELTGRENIFLNGAILGMSKTEIKRKFDEIVSFAEVDKFLDTPVKRYSSGMYVRLAFAVAAHLNTELLLVDEVLAVGDVQFQKKCLNKMDNISTEEGRTILFVSHNMAAVLNLCDYCIWMDYGKIREIDSSDKVVDNYLNINYSLESSVCWDPNSNAPGDNEYIYFTSLKLLSEKGETIGKIYSDEKLWIEIEYKVLKKLLISQIGIRLNSINGLMIFQSGDTDLSSENIFRREPGNYRSRCLIPANLLNQGIYLISLYGHIPGIKMLVNEENIISFEVILKRQTDGYGKQLGIIKPILQWEVINID